MKTFNTKLSLALEGLKHYRIGDVSERQPEDQDEERYGGGFEDYETAFGDRWNTIKPYNTPKLYKMVGRKLSRLLKHDIIIIAGNNLEQFEGGPEEDDKIIELAKQVDIDPNDFLTSITLLIVGNNNQRSVTPWLVLHQLGEALANQGFDVWYGFIAKKYEAALKRAPEIDLTVSDDAEAYGEDADWSLRAWHHLFKFKSARLLLHGGFDNIDPGQELVAEFLWHGGRVRINYPDWIDRRIVDSIKSDIEEWIDDLLTKLKGTRLVNEIDPSSEVGFTF